MGNPPEGVVVRVGGIGAKTAGRELGPAEVAELQEIVHAVIDKPQGTGGKPAVAPTLVQRRRLENENPPPLPHPRPPRPHAGIARPPKHDIRTGRNYPDPITCTRAWNVSG